MSPRTSAQNKLIREQRKGEILEAALVLFAKNGYAATTIDQLAEAAGTSKGLLYNYFSGKQELLEEIFNHMLAQAESIWQLDESSTAHEQLRQLLDATFLYMQEHKDLMKLIMQLALQPDVVQDLSALITQSQTSKLLFMEPLLREMGYDNPKEEAYFLGAFLDGLALGSMVINEDYPLDQMKKRIYQHYKLP
jgi:AcrR family transcriptional regulator